MIPAADKSYTRDHRLLRVHIASLTKTGPVRASNQDDFHAKDELLAVFDGMGGHAGGEVASAEAVAHFDTADPTYFDYNRIPETLEQLLIGAHRRIYDRAQRQPQYHGMGTTGVGLYLAPFGPDGFISSFSHVGDSRLYRLNLFTGDLVQFTVDHTRVQALVDLGKITPEEAKVHPHKNMLSQCLGYMPDDPDPDSAFSHAIVGDVFLLSSDGLHGAFQDNNHLRDTLIRLYRTENSDPAVLSRLIERAHTLDGGDNATGIIARIGPGDLPFEDPSKLGRAYKEVLRSGGRFRTPQRTRDGYVLRDNGTERTVSPIIRRYQRAAQAKGIERLGHLEAALQALDKTNDPTLRWNLGPHLAQLYLTEIEAQGAPLSRLAVFADPISRSFACGGFPASVRVHLQRYTISDRRITALPPSAITPIIPSGSYKQARDARRAAQKSGTAADYEHALTLLQGIEGRPTARAYNEGLCYKGLGRLDDAQAAFAYGLTTASNGSDMHRWLQREHRAVVAEIEQNRLAATYQRGFSQRRAGDIDAALTTFAQLPRGYVAVEPGRVEYQIGVCHAAKGDARAALHSYNAGLALAPKGTDTRRWLQSAKKKLRK